MRPRRIYLPLTPGQLDDLATHRCLASPVNAYAARPTPRAETRSAAGADEDAEYLAFEAAARQPARPGQARRIIASADAPAGGYREVPTTAGDCVSVVTTEDLPLRAFVSIHIDEQTSAGAGEADLLWYDITELDTVLEQLGPVEK